MRRWFAQASAALLEVGMVGGRVDDFHAGHAKKWHGGGKQAGSTTLRQDR
jgi:hypothetical protein